MWSSLLKIFTFLILIFGGAWADVKDSLPAMNICVFEDEPTVNFINCLIEKVDKDMVEKTLSSIQELFPDSTLLETLRYVCKANNDEGHVIVDAIADNLSEEELKANVPIVWVCHDAHLL